MSVTRFDDNNDKRTAVVINRENSATSSSTGDNGLPENSTPHDLKIIETDQERNDADKMTTQFSSTWTGNGHDNLQKSLSKNLQSDTSLISNFAHNPSFMCEYNGIRLDSFSALEYPQMLNQPSAILADMKYDMSFSRNSSSNMNIPSNLCEYSRNPSVEVSAIKDFPVSGLPSYDVTLQNVPLSNQYANGNNIYTASLSPTEAHETEREKPWQGYISTFDYTQSDIDLSRVDSYNLYQPSFAELKRQRSIPSQQGTIEPVKFIRQNTQNQYANQYQSPLTCNTDDIESVSEGSRRMIVAKVNGVDYTSEIRKKDKRDPMKWTSEEDDMLRRAVMEMGERQWKMIAMRIPGRNHVQCLQRWKKVLRPGLKKGHWTEEEDALLKRYKDKCANWADVADNITGRTAKQCRERWCNHVDPNIRKSEWTDDEDNLIISLQKQWGNRWSSIAEQLSGRSENAVKIRYKSLMRRNATDTSLPAVVPLQPVIQSQTRHVSSLPQSPAVITQSSINLPFTGFYPVTMPNDSVSIVTNNNKFQYNVVADENVNEFKPATQPGESNNAPTFCLPIYSSETGQNISRRNVNAAMYTVPYQYGMQRIPSGSNGNKSNVLNYMLQYGTNLSKKTENNNNVIAKDNYVNSQVPMNNSVNQTTASDKNNMDSNQSLPSIG